MFADMLVEMWGVSLARGQVNSLAKRFTLGSGGRFISQWFISN